MSRSVVGSLCLHRRPAAAAQQESSMTKTSPIKGLDELEVITLFVEDVAACKKFYLDVFGLEVIFEDADSALLKLRNLMLNLITVGEAPTLIEPHAVAAPTAGG